MRFSRFPIQAVFLRTTHGCKGAYGHMSRAQLHEQHTVLLLLSSQQVMLSSLTLYHSAFHHYALLLAPVKLLRSVVQRQATPGR